MTCLGRSPVDTEVYSDNLKGRKLLWRRIRRKVDIKTNLKEIVREDVNRIHLAQGIAQLRVVVNTVLNLRVT